MLYFLPYRDLPETPNSLTDKEDKSSFFYTKGVVMEPGNPRKPCCGTSHLAPLLKICLGWTDKKTFSPAGLTMLIPSNRDSSKLKNYPPEQDFVYGDETRYPKML